LLTLRCRDNHEPIPQPDRGSAMRRSLPAKFDRRWLSLGVITIGSFMTLLDSTIVNVALPGITKDFHADVGQGQLVVTLYLISLAVVIPLSGFLGERFGLKRVYMLTLTAFIASSALCALAWSLPILVFFRVLQGLGGGMLQPVGMAIMFTMITPLERGRFMIILGLPILLGPILGPTVGGYLVDYVSWRAIFLINLPAGLIALFFAQRWLKEVTSRPTTKLDVPGFVLIALSFPALLVGLSEGAEKGWGAPLGTTLIVGGAIGVVLFVYHELHHHDPLLQLRLFSHPMFAISSAMQFITQFCFFGSNYLLPLVLQDAYHISASRTGLLLFPVAICDFVAINISGRMYNKLGPRPFALLGLSFLFGSALALSQIRAGTSEAVIASIAAMRGFGMGFCMMPVQTMAFNTVPQNLMPRATALSNVMMRIFGSASTAILTSIVVIALTFHGAPSGATVTSGGVETSILLKAFGDAFLAMAFFSAVGLVLALFLHDDVLHTARHVASQVPAEVEVALAEG
jgi:EmrB/QacA subfamily drug resistance transporter